MKLVPREILLIDPDDLAKLTKITGSIVDCWFERELGVVKIAHEGGSAALMWPRQQAYHRLWDEWCTPIHESDATLDAMT